MSADERLSWLGAAMTSLVLDRWRTAVRILQCIELLLDLMLVIRAQGKHSCGVTIPDRFVGVDDMN